MMDNWNAIEELIEQNISIDFVNCHISEHVPYHSSWRHHFPFNGIVCPEVGECSYELPSGEKWTIKPGECLIIPGGIHHKFEMIDGIVSSTHLQFKIFDNIDLLSLFSVPLILTGKECAQVYELLIQLNSTLIEKQNDKVSIQKVIKYKSTVLQLLTLILELSEMKSEGLTFIVNFQKILPVIKFIQEHLDQNISRDDMANVISLSPTRFHYVFTEIMKISPGAYLKKVRMDKAQQLLISTDLPISEIGDKVGFSDIFHFSKQFKKTFGMSPTKYRENLNLSLFAGGIKY